MSLLILFLKRGNLAVFHTIVTDYPKPLHSKLLQIAAVISFNWVCGFFELLPAAGLIAGQQCKYFYILIKDRQLGIQGTQGNFSLAPDPICFSVYSPTLAKPYTAPFLRTSQARGNLGWEDKGPTGYFWQSLPCCSGWLEEPSPHPSPSLNGSWDLPHTCLLTQDPGATDVRNWN